VHLDHHTRRVRIPARAWSPGRGRGVAGSALAAKRPLSAGNGRTTRTGLIGSHG
jgi:hypothetical protein